MPKAPKEKSSKASNPTKPSKTFAEAQGSKAASSIDDIFASKPKTQPPTSTSKGKAKATETNGTSSDPSKKKKKKKTIASFEPEAEEAAPVKISKAPVEVVDPSLPVPKAKKEVVPEVTKKGKKKSEKETEEDEIFRDSRGTGPRRKTEEGFLIYKEAELQIDPEAGGTPLCPFDCDCCF